MLSGSVPAKNYLGLLRSALVLSAVFVALSGALSSAADPDVTAVRQVPPAGESFVPSEYGKVIYQRNHHSPQQIFIIGQSHRSALTGLSGPDTVSVQAEIYRIGEWLIHEQHVGLLLPEGFFQRRTGSTPSRPDAPREEFGFDTPTLRAELSDTSRFVNADLLLSSSYNIPLGQIEDEQLYRNIGRLLHKARRENNLSLFKELDDLQDERTATLLQNIPDVVEKAFLSGSIENHKAMFTVGLAHVNTIINILQRGSLSDLQLPQGDVDSEGLKLLDQGYGVTVIIPRTLAENKRLLHLCKLNQVVPFESQSR